MVGLGTMIVALRNELPNRKGDTCRVMVVIVEPSPSSPRLSNKNKNTKEENHCPLFSFSYARFNSEFPRTLVHMRNKELKKVKNKSNAANQLVQKRAAQQSVGCCGG